MANTCDTCGESVYRTIFRGGKFVGVDCRCYTERVATDAEHSQFSDFTLEHVHDEYGKPVRVTSMRQLQEAEKRYHFSSVVLAQDAANIDRAPQQKALTVRDVYRSIHARPRR